MTYRPKILIFTFSFWKIWIIHYFFVSLYDFSHTTHTKDKLGSHR